MNTCGCAMWFIGWMVAFFGIIITVFGVFLPYYQNNRLNKIKTSLEKQALELTKFKETYESTLKDLEIKRKKLTEKEIRINEIEMEERTNAGLKDGDELTSSIYAKIYRRIKLEGLN